MCKSEKEGGLMPAGAEWMARGELQHAWKGKHFSLGWWAVQEKYPNSASGREIETWSGREGIGERGDMEVIQLADEAVEKTNSRFGIDVGSPIRLGFRQRKAGETE